MTALDTRALPTGHRGLTPRLLVVLALLSALAPFGTDLYLSAFPIMTTDLDTSATAVQLSLTAFLVGIALGQLVFGPLSDRVGRLRPLLVGAVVCVAASAVAALAPTIGILIAARLVQGLTGAAGMVIGRAVISDLASGKAAARAFSLMMIVGGVAPVVAPLVGSLLVSSIGWRGILWVVFGIVAASCLAVALVVRESHTPARRAAARSTAGPSGLGDLRSRRFLGYTLAFAFAFAVMMAYISASPFVYQVMIGLSAPVYGALFGLNAVGLVVVSAVSARLAATRSEHSLVRLGLLLILAATVSILILVLSGAPVAFLPIPLFVAVSSLGLVLGNATALALGAVPRAAGSGSAVLGALQFGLAALVSPLVGLGGESTALPLAVVMISCAVIAMGAFLVIGRARPTT